MPCCVVCGSVWLCVAPCGCGWLCVALCGCVWLCVAVCGLWLCVVVWPCLAVFDICMHFRTHILTHIPTHNYSPMKGKHTMVGWGGAVTRTLKRVFVCVCVCVFLSFPLLLFFGLTRFVNVQCCAPLDNACSSAFIVCVCWGVLCAVWYVSIVWMWHLSK